ncbi:MAG: sulfurtransferase [Candidatus Omnitrophica bacterium]|nr:sulfurtransferase [Candidatus Omnitrophota bacterium]MBU1784928.1 sulfurtransferase [Candidatus Omnitrophota bacterium]MBU1851717.1 sulfurtransferase [Candidatus Omnitrophota bacterium]
MNKLALLTSVLILSIGVSVWATEKCEPRVPHAGGDLTPTEAYKMLTADPRHTFLIDVRTRPEYEFVGHPTRAYNIPYMFWTSEGMKINPDFVKDVAKKFKKTGKLLIICRSGKRSCFACDLLVQAGFKNVSNVLSGFEGDMVKDENSPNYGHRRRLNGWQRDNMPWSYELKKGLVYRGE